MKEKFLKTLGIFTLVLGMGFSAAFSSPVFAEDGDEYTDDGTSDDSGEEEPFIPDEYYEPVQTNDIGGWPSGEAIQASSGVVMDMDTGAFLYSKNASRKLMPASITKIMTALLVLENTDPDDVITCTDAVYELDEGASNIALEEGEKISVRDATYALMLESANDAANALAVHIAGSVSAFCDMMNNRAAELGCTVTHFANPNGLTNDEHYTCARDMALIASTAYQNENFRNIIQTREYEIKPTNKTEESRYFSNHHRMIQPDSDYYVKWCKGGKTGYTEAAWNTLVTYAEKGDLRLVCVLMHGNGADQNYLETTDLLRYGLNNFVHMQAGGLSAAPTLGRAMKVSYLGDGAVLEADNLSQRIASITGSEMVTVPEGTDAGAVSTSPFKGQDGTNALAGEFGSVSGQNADIQPTEGAFYYTFGGWPVGCRRIEINPVSFDLDIPWQAQVEVTLVAEEGETGDKQEAAQKSNEQVWANVENYVMDLDQKRQNFWEKYRTEIILGTGVAVIALLLVLLVLLVRSTRNYRLRKKMRLAQREAEKREKEIEEKTTEEIEQELREAMKSQRKNGGQS